jgi:hypothetical protein
MNQPHERKPTDPGAYIGQNPERAADSIPGGVQPEDERVAAHSTQSGPTSAPEPSGHRESPVGDDEVREAGQDR